MIRSLFDSSIKAQLGIVDTYIDQLDHKVAWSSGANLTLRSSAFLTLPLAVLTPNVNEEFNNRKVLTLPLDHDADEGGENELVEKTFGEDQWDLRILLNFSPDLEFGSLTQYNTPTKEPGPNNRLHRTNNSLDEIFIVYKNNLIRDSENDCWPFVSNELPVKIHYTCRFNTNQNKKDKLSRIINQ